MGKVNLFKEFKNTINNNSLSFKTINELNSILLEIKSNLSELSEKQEIKLNKLESKLERFESKVVINKLNDTSLIHKNEILNTVADLDTSVIKPFINTINKINETDLPEILEAIQSIPTTDLKPALDEIKTDVKGFLAALESVPTVEDINSAVEQITGNIMGDAYLSSVGGGGGAAGGDLGTMSTVPEMFGSVDTKLDAITGAIASLDCSAPQSELEVKVNELENLAASYFVDDQNIDNRENEILENAANTVQSYLMETFPNFIDLNNSTGNFIQYMRFIGVVEGFDLQLG